MKATPWKQKIRAWTARTPLWLFLIVSWGQCFVFLFLSTAVLNYWLDDQSKNSGDLGIYYWVAGIGVSVVTAFGATPMILAQWYEARRVPEPAKTKRSGLYFIYVVGWLGCVLFPGMDLINKPNSRAQTFPLHWTRAQGTLLSFKSGTGTENYFQPNVLYCYTVDGRRYQSSQVSFKGEGNGGVPFSTALPWKKLVGHAIPVYYDAAHPQLAALVVRRGPNYDLLIQLSIFAFAWCMGLAAVFHEDAGRTAGNHRSDKVLPELKMPNS
jgi:hypothetical protein